MSIITGFAKDKRGATVRKAYADSWEAWLRKICVSIYRRTTCFECERKILEVLILYC